MSPDGIFLVLEPLGDNLSLTDITSEIGGGETFDGVNLWEPSDVSSYSVYVATNAAGVIDQWNITLTGSGPLAGYELETYWNGSTGEDVVSDGILAQNVNDPGTWSETSPVPEPPSGFDLALGMFALGAVVVALRLRPRRA
jgi:hypothetical protein